ncbi:MAG: hypothetical protein IIC76_11730 [Bacteroidetes bacterium]|nr:hypothetical protein [Bacteroidota bacterium]
MKKRLSILLFGIGIAAFSLTGCYTQIAVQDDDSYVYHEPPPIIIFLPAPCPQPVPVPPRQNILFPENPPKKEKIRKPVTPPANNDRIRDDLRNSGGRNQGGKRNRR